MRQIQLLLLILIFLPLAGGQTVNTPASLKEVPDHLKPFLPENGGVFVSGGLMFVGRMVVFDLDSKQLTFLEGKENNQPVNPEIDTKTTLTLSEEALAELEHRFRMVFFSPQVFRNDPPLADFDTILIMQWQGSSNVIHSYGPPMSYLEDLYTFLWQLNKEQ
jgi:hypothetical protein